MKTIAIDVDDTLNNFTETLQNTRFAHDAAYGISPETFDKYIEMLRAGTGDSNDLLSTEYTYFRYRIYHECYNLAAARADGVEFVRWLRANEWRIVICTHRDLRRSNNCTRKWLEDNGIPFDYLFMALHKLNFCKAWGIEYLVDDHLFNLVCNDSDDVQVFYPIMPKHARVRSPRGRGFANFDELKQWIQK